MAEETTPAGQAPASGQAPHGAGQTSEAGQAPEEQFDPERARALIAKLREEAKQATKALTATQAQQKAAEDAKLSEQEKLAKRVAELEANGAAQAKQLTERVLAYEVQLAASKLGIVDPEVAARLLDASKLELDAEGRPTNVTTLLKDLVKAKPYLAAAPAATPASVANPARSAPAGTRTYTTTQLKDFKFYTANKADIQAAMREGRILTE